MEEDQCVDSDGWIDAQGDHCSWYEQFDPTCEVYGWQAQGSDALYPMEACCVCGGGSYFVPFPSTTPSTAASSAPSITGKLTISIFFIVLIK